MAEGPLALSPAPSRSASSNHALAGLCSITLFGGHFTPPNPATVAL